MIAEHELILADHSPMVRQAFAGQLEQVNGYQVISEAGDAEAVEAAVERAPRATLLIDPWWPTMGGFELLERVIAKQPRTNILICTMSYSREQFREASRLSIPAYVLKMDPLHELTLALNAMHGGSIYYSTSVQKMLKNQYLNAPEVFHRLTLLSQKDLRVLRMISHGMTSREIAAELECSARTIEKLRGRLIRAIGVSSVAGLVRFAVQHGLD